MFCETSLHANHTRLQFIMHYTIKSYAKDDDSSHIGGYNSCMLWCYLKVWLTVKIRRTRVPQKAIVPVGRPRPYSIMILNIRFIPKASLRASSQITASSYILERHLWVNNSKLFALAPTWSLACKQTDCITAGMLKLLDLKLVLTSQ